jgi:hypothetical protein
MMAPLSLLDRFPIARGRARVDHVNGLDAFLDSHASSSPPTPVREPAPADWTAPALQVALIYDTAAHRLPSGIRALVQEGTRRVMLAADEYELVLHVVAGDGRRRVGLVGQLLYQGLPLADRWVRAHGMGALVVCATGRAGSFRLPSLEAGVYELEIAVGPHVLTVSGISLPHQEAESKEKRCVRPYAEGG